ncbi:MAG: 4-(cytidine 5'-diphospho)-2-C-methyl-D-erythritol kinase [Acidimicrobiales bacterium]|nr:4-(cytidine 5'-diphospho)-2-C-methyl-D-erythritol kinase [Acidimicrobiales bacterium]|tara:strand:- start:36 stop:749 length:714 start_codon:yes stop_codon:yes gene_type:complete
MVSTELFAPAKLTLSLRVVGVRPDGFHEIEAEMVSLDFGDRLVVSEGVGLEVVGLEVDADDNLVVRALRLAGRTARVRIEKAVAAGAGLGGGSSDAAAILRWAGFDDLVAAASIGADVAYCLVGGRARVTGMGEVVEPLPFEERRFTLLTPPVACPTPAVYRRWDELGGPVGDHGNDLEPAAVDLVPELLWWRDEMADATGQRPRLAGSGSTWFVEGEYPGGERRVVRTLPPPVPSA